MNIDTINCCLRVAFSRSLSKSFERYFSLGGKNIHWQECTIAFVRYRISNLYKRTCLQMEFDQIVRVCVLNSRNETVVSSMYMAFHTSQIYWTHCKLSLSIVWLGYNTAFTSILSHTRIIRSYKYSTICSYRLNRISLLACQCHFSLFLEKKVKT